MATRRREAIYNVIDYGADATSSVDSAPGIQAAINAAIAGLAGIPGVEFGYNAIVYFPAGVYRIFSPIYCTSSHITFRGGGLYGVNLYVAFAGETWYNGPAITWPLTAGLTTSGGNALQLTGEANPVLLPLRDLPGGDIHAIPSFTIEFFYRTDALGPSDPAYIVLNGGARYAGAAFDQTLYLVQFASGVIQVGLTTTGGSYTASTAALTVGVTYHIAVSWDGSTLRIFRAGILAASAATTGTFIQETYHDFVLGYRPDSWPTQGILTQSVKATIDSFRLSDTALYTANFTPPTAKLSATSTTRLLYNFATQVGPFTRTESNLAGAGGTGYTILFPVSTFSGGALVDLNMEGFHFSSAIAGGVFNGPYNRSILNSRWEHLQVEGARAGIQFYDNCYQTIAHDIYVVLQNATSFAAVSRFGLIFAGACGILDVQHIHLTGGSYPFVVARDAGGIFTDVFIEVSQFTKWGYSVLNTDQQTPCTFVQPTLNNEISGGAPIEYPFFLAKSPNVAIVGGILSMIGANACLAAVAINGGGAVTFENTGFLLDASVPEIVHITSNPTKPVVITDSFNPNNVPASLTPSKVIQWPGPILDSKAIVKDAATGQNELSLLATLLTADRSLTAQDASYIIAALNIAQSWTTGNQTFASGILRATRPQITTSIDDANGNEAITTLATGGAVNNVGLTNAATGNAPIVEAVGDDTNVSLTVRGKGTGRVLLTSPETITGNSSTLFSAGRQGATNPGLNVDASAASCVTGFNIAALAAGGGVTFTVTSSGTDESGQINAKGAGNLGFQSNRCLISSTGKVQSKAGTGASPTTATITHAGSLYVNTSVVGNVGAGEDNLHSTTIEANTFAEDNDSAEFIVAGNWTVGAATRSARLYYAGTLIVALTSASTDQKWLIKGTMIRVDATNMRFAFEAHLSPSAGTTPTQFFARESTVSATHSSGNIFKCTGESSAATNNDVTQTVTRIWKASAP